MTATDRYQGMLAEIVTISGANGDAVDAYLARPLGPGPFPGIVLAHHMPGWDEFYMETTRRFAAHGFAAICPNLYMRAGHGTPEDVAAKVRGEGGVPDAQVVADLAAARDFVRRQRYSTGKVAVFGTCSGGRHALLAASLAPGFDAVLDLWGGRVVMAQGDLTPKQPVAPIDYTPQLACPLLGLFGDEDRSPSAEQVNQHEEALKRFGKQYEFHRYPGAGHGFFYYQTPLYRAEAAADGWKQVFAFLGRTVA